MELDTVRSWAVDNVQVTAEMITRLAEVQNRDSLEIEALDQVADEKHRIAGIERFAQMRRKQLTLVLFVLLELDLIPHARHLYQMTSLGSGS